MNYILNGRTPMLCDNLSIWGMEFDKRTKSEDHWRVARETVNGVDVSTVFLGIDHAFGGGPPLLFETMIFGGPHNEYQERYSTWEEAEAGHKRAVELATAGLCKCGGPGVAAHSCPFRAEIHNDETSQCNCCAGCAHECAMDI